MAESLADDDLASFAAQVRACRICRACPSGKPLPHEPRPVFVESPDAPILIAGQAPGTRVHASGRPFTDPSGERLRAWLAVSDDTFYDPRHFAIVPMGFCFPGLDAKGADLPPRRECAPAWRDGLLRRMPGTELVLAIGGPAQRWHLGADARPDVTSTVAAWRSILDRPVIPKVFPLPHPSWRNSGWLKRHEWFAEELLPVLRSEIRRLIDTQKNSVSSD